MRSVRRAYYYAISLISLEVLIWGAASLLRTLTHLGDLLGGSELIAGGLSLVLVGLPVFALHWNLAQKDARRDEEEASSLLRALFLYTGLLIILLPIVQNGLSLVNHLFFALFGIEDSQTLIGQGQVWSDNLIAMIINGVAGLYLYTVLSGDWSHLEGEQRFHLINIRRIYRYLWMIYALGLTVIGIQQIVYYISYIPAGIGGGATSSLANGLALLVTGVPLWVWTLQRTDELLEEEIERESMLRRVVLYLLSLAGVGTVLGSGGFALSLVLRWLLGADITLDRLINQAGEALSLAIPLGGVWLYYGHRLAQDVKEVSDTPRRAALRRLYTYILSLFGLGVTVIGMHTLLLFLVRSLMGGSLAMNDFRNNLANGIASLVIGLPLWLRTWGPMELEASQTNDSGEHARRSVIRKAYLYLILFAGVGLCMSAIGGLLFNLFNSLFSTPNADFFQTTIELLTTAVLIGGWTAYHLRALRLDGSKEEKTLASRHSVFPTIIFERDEEPYAEFVVAALGRQAPMIPVVVQKVSQGIPGEEMGEAQAIVIPAGLASQPPEALRIWLQNYTGRRLVVPETQENWFWLGSVPANHKELGVQVAAALRQMAEGQSIRTASPVNAWQWIGCGGIVFFILGILFLIAALITAVGGL